jgi:hypothetical protein
VSYKAILTEAQFWTEMLLYEDCII